MAVDPLTTSAILMDPQSWNRYSYVRNNPLNAIDPTGMEDNRTEEDKQVLDDPDVKKATQDAWNESKPDEKDGNDMQEVGFNVDEAQGGDCEAGERKTDGDPLNVVLPPPSEDTVATVHTHPTSDRWVTDKDTGRRGKGNKEHSPKDMQHAREDGVTSYVVARDGIYKFARGMEKPERVLDGPEFKGYMGWD